MQVAVRAAMGRAPEAGRAGGDAAFEHDLGAWPAPAAAPAFADACRPPRCGCRAAGPRTGTRTGCRAPASPRPGWWPDRRRAPPRSGRAARAGPCEKSRKSCAPPRWASQRMITWLRPDHLLAVDAQVLPLPGHGHALLRPARDHQAPGDQGTRVAGPAGLHRQPAEVESQVRASDRLAVAGRSLRSARASAPDPLSGRPSGQPDGRPGLRPAPSGEERTMA
jgi:hypothetical protein